MSRAIVVSLILPALLCAAFGQGKPYPKPQTPSATEQPAPNFSLKDQNGATFTLADQRGKWVLLYFYRGYW